jgi:hypothetical protein
MNGMNDQKFFNLAMKTIAGQSTDAERAELEALMARQPELKGELDKLRTDARLAREVLPIVAAAESSRGQFPAYARERLQTKVRQTLGSTQVPARRTGWNLRWILGIATGAAVILLLALPSFKPGAPVIEVAVLDSAGAVRGSETEDAKILQQEWRRSTIQQFAQPSELETWQANWPDGARLAAKVIYDRAAGELKVIFRANGEITTRSFPVDGDLSATLQQVKAYLAEQTRR